MKRTLSSIVLALVAALAFAGCGNKSDSSTSAGVTMFNNADVTFAQSMIPHHRQAVEMSKLAQSRASSPQLKRLADKIVGAQGPEITTMSGWLEDWGKKVPAGSMSGMSGMSDSSSSMPGMMSGAAMKKLAVTSGRRFDAMFLSMMISHHTGAIAMAETEQRRGKNPAAVALAKKIQADQTAQIAEMKKLRTL